MVHYVSNKSILQFFVWNNTIGSYWCDCLTKSSTIIAKQLQY